MKNTFLRCGPAADRNGDSSSAPAKLDAVPLAEPVECTLHRRDGELVPVLMNTRRLQDGAGQVTGTVCIFTDLRPLKALQGRGARLRARVPNNAGEDRLIGASLQ